MLFGTLFEWFLNSKEHTMQILPTLRISLSEAARNEQTARSSTETDTFADVLNEAEEMLIPSEASAGRSIDPSQLYTRHSTDGYTYSLEEVCFTQKELCELYTNLLNKGAPKDRLDRLGRLAELPGGANLGQVMVSLKGAKSQDPLSDEDANNIISLFDGLDPSGELSGNILDALYRGNSADALHAVHNALDSLDPLEALTVSKQDLLSFGRGLGLSEGELEKLGEPFGSALTATLPVAHMKKLMAPIESNVLAEKGAREKLDHALETTLTPILSQARSRMAKEAQAQSLKNREASHSKTMIDKTVQKESRMRLNAILDAVSREENTTGELAATPVLNLSPLDLSLEESRHLFTQAETEEREEAELPLPTQRAARKEEEGERTKRTVLTQERISPFHLQPQEGKEELLPTFSLSPLSFSAERLHENTDHPLLTAESSSLTAPTPVTIGNQASLQNLFVPRESAPTAETLTNFENAAHEQLLSGEQSELSFEEHNGNDVNRDLARHNSFQAAQHKDLLRSLKNLRLNSQEMNRLEQSVHQSRQTETSAARARFRVA